MPVNELVHSIRLSHSFLICLGRLDGFIEFLVVFKRRDNCHGSDLADRGELLCLSSLANQLEVQVAEQGNLPGSLVAKRICEALEIQRRVSHEKPPITARGA